VKAHPRLCDCFPGLGHDWHWAWTLFNLFGEESAWILASNCVAVNCLHKTRIGLLAYGLPDMP
jgi:hypothetical protein